MGEMTESELNVALEGMSDEGKRLLMSLLKDDTDASHRVKRVKVKATPLTPHNLIYSITCQLCGTVAEMCFALLLNEKMECLVSTPLHTKPSEFEERKQTVRWCDHCVDTLMKLEKEELVGRVMKVVKGG